MATATATAPVKKASKPAPAATAAPPVKEKKEKTPAAPAQPRTSATPEEVAAAVEGTLKPRKNAAELFALTKAQLEIKDEKGRSKGRPVGMTTGFPILLVWCYIFATNEKAKKSAKLTDEQISAWMKKEFPGRETPAFDHPNTCRLGYNKGDFTGHVAPKIQSHRFDENGEIYVKPTATKAPKKKADIKVVDEGDGEESAEA